MTDAELSWSGNRSAFGDWLKLHGVAGAELTRKIFFLV